MLIKTMALGVVETTLNQLLRLDPLSTTRLRKLMGNVIKVELDDYPPIWFVFSSLGIALLAEYDGTPDGTLTLSPAALGLITTPSAITRYIREEKLDISGELSLIQGFADLFGQLTIDWEEELSRYSGDIVAHTLCNFVKKSRQWLVQERHIAERQLANYLTEEVKFAPSPLEVIHFADQVADLVTHLNCVEERLNNVVQKVAP